MRTEGVRRISRPIGPATQLARSASALAVLAALLGFCCLLPGGALAHSGHSHSPTGFDGRIAGQPDLERVGEATYRYLPAKGEYEIRRPGSPPAFAHGDPAPRPADGGKGVAASPGATVELPSSELAPLCRTSGNRVVVVYTHRSSDETPTPTAALRAVVRRMNWRIADDSSQSGGGARNLRMAVDCNEKGEINVYDVATATNDYSTLFSVVPDALFDLPEGQQAVKYLLFDASTLKGAGGEEIAGVGERRTGIKKNPNANASESASAVVYRGPESLAVPWWETYTPMHEMFHTFGAVQGATGGQEGPAAPFSTLGGHCTDGIDIMCYEDESPPFEYSETRCPAASGYETSAKVPLDCGSDTYFDPAPAPETWLSQFWNLGSWENPFLVAAPKATTEAAAGIGPNDAELRASVNPEGSETEYRFEYGTTTSYGSTTAGAVAGAGTSVAVGESIGNLKPGQTYHCRVVAESDAGTAQGKDQQFTTLLTPSARTQAASAVTSNAASLNAVVNPNGFATSYQFEYGTTTAYGAKAPASPASVGSGTADIEVKQGIAGLQPGTTYHFRVVATSEKGTTKGADRQFTTLGPLVATRSASDLTAKGAKLSATVNPQGLATTYQFEYGTTTSYGSKAPASPKGIGAGTSEVEVSEQIAGLQPATTYHFRVVASNADATSHGKDETFTTPPAALTGPASSVDAQSATLNATVYPDGLETTYQFEYGKTTSYGSKAPASPKAVGSGTKAVRVAEAIAGLELGATYHYRVVATNASGTALGQDRTFRTSASEFAIEEPEEQETARVKGTAGEQLLTTNGTETECLGLFEAEEKLRTKTLTTESVQHSCEQLGQSVALKMNGCGLIFDTGARDGASFQGTFDIGPAGCGPITLDGPSCDVAIGPQAGLAADYANKGEGSGATIEISAHAEGLEYTSSGGSCPDGTFADGKYTAQWQVSAENEVQEPIGLRVDPVTAAPSATTNAATSVSSSKASLNATVNPGLLPTTYQFEYGPTTAYGQSAPATPKSVGSGSEDVAVSETVSGLQSGTTYHFRVVATNAEGTDYGEDRTFVTPALFQAEEYLVKFEGADTANHILTFNGGGFSCTDAAFVGGEAEAASETVTTLETQIGNCTWLGIPKLNWAMNGCNYRFHAGEEVKAGQHAGTVDIVCPSGKKISFTTSGCTIQIPPQTGVGAVTYVNQSWESPPVVQVTADLSGIEYTQSGCSGSGTFHNGTYKGTWRLSGMNEFLEQQGIWVE